MMSSAKGLKAEAFPLFRVEFTKWAANAWEELRKTELIPRAFKRCCLCNDKYGRENHLVKVTRLKSYKPSPRS